MALALVAAPAVAETLRFTVIGIDCAACAPPIVKALKGVSGVSNSKLDWTAGIATVEVPEGFDRTRLREAVAAIGYEAVFDGEIRKDLRPLPEEERRGLDILAASEGTRINLSAVLVPGKVTVLDYWAEWCSPLGVSLDLRKGFHAAPGVYREVFSHSLSGETFHQGTTFSFALSRVFP
jgi:copper chaperone CopZ